MYMPHFQLQNLFITEAVPYLQFLFQLFSNIRIFPILLFCSRSQKEATAKILQLSTCNQPYILIIILRKLQGSYGQDSIIKYVQLAVYQQQYYGSCKEATNLFTTQCKYWSCAVCVYFVCHTEAVSILYFMFLFVVEVTDKVVIQNASYSFGFSQTNIAQVL
eukprot:TRINITY_DN3679_c0_g2_i10.p8 TRINITY_DN3679_c0_g2~~TRINITY_DN3679_c0_g2_i10.p8  ORF type:complete len:162 (-),score=2.61 TRINITY_DN3679_c0_g2_i10:41-526(-)